MDDLVVSSRGSQLLREELVHRVNLVNAITAYEQQMALPNSEAAHVSLLELRTYLESFLEAWHSLLSE